MGFRRTPALVAFLMAGLACLLQYFAGSVLAHGAGVLDASFGTGSSMTTSISSFAD